jgi:lipoprotein NlpI
MDDENDSQGMAAPFYARYVNLVTVEKPELAVKSTPGLIEAYNYLGSVAARKDGDNVKAKEYFDKVLALDPANITATQAVKAIEGSK